MRFLTTPDLRANFGKIQKFSILFKIWLEIDIFDHSGPGKAEIWQNPNILSRTENLAQNYLFDYLKDLQRMKFGKIQKFWVVLKIWLKTYIFDHSGHAKDEIW